MVVPWPPMNLVAEWITMSAPHSIGRHRYGVANVLSIEQRQAVLVRDAGHGLDVEHVPGRVADRLGEERLGAGADGRRQASGSSGSTQVRSTFILRSTCLNWLTVPPYRAEDETTWSPGSSSVNSAAAWAASPLANPTAPAPPSRLATRSSNTATVGFMIRE